LVRQQPDSQNKPTFQIANRQWFHAATVTGPKPAFEVNRPNIIGPTRSFAFGEGQSRPVALMSPLRTHQAHPAQPTPNGAICWKVNTGMQVPQAGSQFARSPTGMSTTQLPNRLSPAQGYLAEVVRTPGTISQAHSSFRPKPTQPFIPGAACHVETAAQFSERASLLQGFQHKSLTNANQ
jgi:hypothetical protein